MWFKLTERVSRVALNFVWLSEVEVDDNLCVCVGDLEGYMGCSETSV